MKRILWYKIKKDVIKNARENQIKSCVTKRKYIKKIRSKYEPSGNAQAKINIYWNYLAIFSFFHNIGRFCLINIVILIAPMNEHLWIYMGKRERERSRKWMQFASSILVNDNFPSHIKSQHFSFRCSLINLIKCALSSLRRIRHSSLKLEKSF